MFVLNRRAEAAHCLARAALNRHDAMKLRAHVRRSGHHWPDVAELKLRRAAEQIQIAREAIAEAAEWRRRDRIWGTVTRVVG